MGIKILYAHTHLQAIDDQLQNLTTLDNKIQYLMTEGNVPSLVAGIVVNDSLVWSRGYGGASQDTVYLIASITKPFVATAVLQLYERNLIDLDDDVNQYVQNVEIQFLFNGFLFFL